MERPITLHEMFAPFYSFKHGVADDKIWTHHRHCDVESHIDVYIKKMSKNISEHTQPVNDHTHPVQLVPIISSADVIMIKSFTLVVPTTTAITIILFVIVYTTHITLNFVVQQLPSSIGTLANKCSYGE